MSLCWDLEGERKSGSQDFTYRRLLILPLSGKRGEEEEGKEEGKEKEKGK